MSYSTTLKDVQREIENIFINTENLKMFDPSDDTGLSDLIDALGMVMEKAEDAQTTAREFLMVRKHEAAKTLLASGCRFRRIGIDGTPLEVVSETSRAGKQTTGAEIRF